MSGADAFSEVARLMALEENRGGVTYAMVWEEGEWKMVRILPNSHEDRISIDPTTLFAPPEEESEADEEEEDEAPNALADQADFANLPGMAPPPDGLDDDDDEEENEEEAVETEDREHQKYIQKSKEFIQF